MCVNYAKLVYLLHKFFSCTEGRRSVQETISQSVTSFMILLFIFPVEPSHRSIGKVWMEYSIAANYMIQSCCDLHFNLGRYENEMGGWKNRATESSGAGRAGGAE